MANSETFELRPIPKKHSVPGLLGCDGQDLTGEVEALVDRVRQVPAGLERLFLAGRR